MAMMAWLISAIRPDSFGMRYRSGREKQRIVETALSYPEKSPRELA
jgi:hypothetical protein